MMLVGCSTTSMPVLTLYPNILSYPKQTVQNKNVSFIVLESIEALRSTNIPIMNNNHTLSTQKDFIWLRPPMQLIQEYIQLHWIKASGKISDSSDNKISLQLLQAQIDNNKEKFTIEIQTVINGQTYNILKTGLVNEIVPTTLTLCHEIIDKINTHIKN